MAVRNCLFRGVFPRSARTPRRPRLTFPCRREPCRLLRRLYGRAWPFRVQRWPAQAESAGAGGGGTRFATWKVNCGTSSSAAARFLHLFKFGLVVYGTSVFRGQAAIVRFPPVSFFCRRTLRPQQTISTPFGPFRRPAPPPRTPQGLRGMRPVRRRRAGGRFRACRFPEGRLRVGPGSGKWRRPFPVSGILCKFCRRLSGLPLLRGVSHGEKALSRLRAENSPAAGAIFALTENISYNAINISEP